ncbi:hypothetical protein HK104_007107 [Borealophlyctis nickersoniae]|nr:hypothetical protein HK104_007107 [Borealophlyctis nickersoniae]
MSPGSAYLGLLAKAALQDQARQINPELDSTKRKLLDPTLNLLVRAMRKELAEKNKKMEELQQEVLGNNFTPYSIPGKKLVAKLRALQQENEELGKQLCQGRVEQLQIELALQKKANERLKDQLKEADKMAVNLDEEAETMQSIIFNLKAKVRWYEDRYGQITQDDDGAGIKAERDGVTDVKGKTKSSVGGDERSDERLDSGRRTAWSATPDSEQGRGRYVGVRTTPDLAPAKEEKMESDTRKDGKT